MGLTMNGMDNRTRDIAEETMLDVLADAIAAGLSEGKTDIEILNACAKADTPRIPMPAGTARPVRKRTTRKGKDNPR